MMKDLQSYRRSSKPAVLKRRFQILFVGTLMLDVVQILHVLKMLRAKRVASSRETSGAVASERRRALMKTARATLMSCVCAILPEKFVDRVTLIHCHFNSVKFVTLIYVMKIDQSRGKTVSFSIRLLVLRALFESSLTIELNYTPPLYWRSSRLNVQSPAA